MRDVETGNSKAFAFINFASFDASDAAIEAMNSQYLCNRPISVSYAFKKDVKGERHGSAAERYFWNNLTYIYYLYCFQNIIFLLIIFSGYLQHKIHYLMQIDLINCLLMLLRLSFR